MRGVGSTVEEANKRLEIIIINTLNGGSPVPKGYDVILSDNKSGKEIGTGSSNTNYDAALQEALNAAQLTKEAFDQGNYRQQVIVSITYHISPQAARASSPCYDDKAPTIRYTTRM